MAAVTTRSWRTPTLIVVGVFALSRALYALAGVRFLYRHAPLYLHFLDPAVLEDDLARSLWYDHAQPPGLNLIWGLALKLSPSAPDRLLWPLFLATGLATGLVLLHLLKRVGLGPRAAVVVTSLWVVSPTAVLLETYLLYTPFEVLGVLLVMLLCARWASQGWWGDAVALGLVLAALGLTRASFHLLWIVLVLALVFALRRDRWQVAAVGAAIPLLLVGGWYAKNQQTFDQFGPSSWMGNNISRITVEQLPDDDRYVLYDAGVLSEYAPYPAFATFEEMGIEPPHVVDPDVRTPVLDAYTREGNDFPNLRQRDYLVVSRARFDDALWVLRHRPSAYARGVSRSASVTFALPADFFGYGPNVDHIEPLVTAERWAMGGWSELPPPGADDLGDWGNGAHEWLVLAAYLIALGAVPVMGWKQRPEHSQLALVAVGWGTVGYLTAVGILVDFGENNRFRSVTDPAVLVLLAWLVVAWRSGRQAEEGHGDHAGAHGDPG